MRPKLESSIAQLFKLKNQIRLQLNKLRPSKDIFIYEKQASKKKIFAQRYEPTNIIEPSEHNSQQIIRPRRQYNEMGSNDNKLSRIIQRRHYERHYEDKLHIEHRSKRLKSAYLTPRRRGNDSNFDNNRSMTSLCMNNKQPEDKPRGKRILHSRIFKSDLLSTEHMKD